jgi:general stress protein YciG
MSRITITCIKPLNCLGEKAFVSFPNGRGSGRKQEAKMANARGGGSKRGFAAMSPEKQREIAAKGGRASHGGGRRPGSSRSGSRSGR